MARPVREVFLNAAQLMFDIAPQRIKTFEGGRGVGKSTLLGRLLSRIVHPVTGMPRSKGFLSGTSFRDMLSITLPAIMEGMEMFGLIKNVHYFVGSDRGVKKFGWEEPFQPPNDYTTCIHFYSGAVLQLMSQDKSSVSRRGFNFDWGMGDEAALQDEIRYTNECVYATRTNRPRFKGNPLYLSRTLVTSTPMTRSGLWVLKGEELARKEPDKHFFLRANALVNKHNLAPDWFDTALKESPSRMHFDAEVMNIRPRLTVNGYYPGLKPHHYYGALDGDHYINRFASGLDLEPSSLGDRDCDPEHKLIVDFDPGAAINSFVVKQLKGRLLRSINCFYSLYPDLISHAAGALIRYYRHHKHKEVDLYYDRTANARQPNSRLTVAEGVADQFRKAGWIVNMKTVGAAVVRQDEKYHLIAMAMEEKDKRLPVLRINRDNCRELIISLENTEAKEDDKGAIKKDKSSERRSSVDPQHATHMGDAWDLSTFYIIKQMMSGVGDGGGGGGFTIV